MTEEHNIIASQIGSALKTTYTLAEYIENPLSVEDIKAFKKRENIKENSAWGGALFVALLIVITAPPEIKIVAVFGVFTFIPTLFAMECIRSLNGVRISDRCLVESSSVWDRPLYEHHETFNHPDAIKLKSNVKKMGRPFIKLDRDIIQNLYMTELTSKINEMHDKTGS